MGDNEYYILKFGGNWRKRIILWSEPHYTFSFPLFYLHKNTWWKLIVDTYREHLTMTQAFKENSYSNFVASDISFCFKSRGWKILKDINGGGCYCLVTKSHLTLCDPMDCSPPGFSAYGISQARILEWVAIPFYSWSSQPRDWTCISCIIGRFFTNWATMKDSK